MPQQPDPTYDVAGADLGASRQLRKSLEALRSAAAGPEVSKQLDDVIAVRTSMREFGKSDAFAGILDRVLTPQAMNKLSGLSPAELEAMAEQGRAEQARLRTEPTAAADALSAQDAPRTPLRPETPQTVQLHPGTRKPNREQVVTPDEPDEDDLYFQERRQRGWLV
ncbi:hypothetical protein IU438_07070 [Nocardia cyriacigeorgica]|uniref:hypothetical protein n=1 Tax=Nocardia cyriacigeorgica TaxID=135487 RepID=UPI0018944A45|nr:hypothetical protein [Nocardia cyriacigeorgica]MBF6086837.1 hypothetical protein [Nocardia cyriacigeorgica]MBF6090838.1 hypothetical protein [Nocardia cyriacigeorgica]MBF6395550.1 hypothetical protein [Nocardia cyriacigeorgica]MBF6401182.1 hypothetical protein [Nocardia cyriacigeorgica]